MKAILISFSLVLLYQSPGFAKDTKPQIVFLGFTSYLSVCLDWTKNAGYKTARYGGYVSGLYRPDACFASDPIENVPPVPEIKTDIHYGQIQGKVLLLKLKADPGYESLMTRAEKMETALDVLYTASEDGLSKPSLQQFYRDVKFEYDMLTYDYYLVHVKVQNAQVAEAWRMFVKAMDKLKKHFET